ARNACTSLAINLRTWENFRETTRVCFTRLTPRARRLLSRPQYRYSNGFVSLPIFRYQKLHLRWPRTSAPEKQSARRNSLVVSKTKGNRQNKVADSALTLFCRQVRKRSQDNKQALVLLHHSSLTGNVMAVLRQ